MRPSPRLILLAAGIGAALRSASAHPSPAEVAALYQDLVGSPPTPTELREGLSTLQSTGARLPVLFALLDSDAFHAALPDDDTYIVATYRLILDRDPTLHEWLNARHFVVVEGVRSLLVAGLLPLSDLGEHSPDPDRAIDRVRLVYDERTVEGAAKVAQAYRALSPAELRDALVAEAASLYAEVTPEEILNPPVTLTDPPDQEYNVYFGYLHSHTNVSFDAWQEGSPGPKEAYRYAREEGGLDWFGVSDHAEYISTFPWNNEWKLLERRADEANDPGSFVALRGFEYSNPLYGHLVVFNTPTFVSTFGAPTLRSFYRWLRRQDGAVATFNHPGEYDLLGTEFYHFAYYPRVDPQIVGHERLQRGEDFTARTPGYGGEISFFDESLRAGWHLGPVSAQDNHAGGWGTVDDNRTGVLATELTRDAILEALAARRFYATMDPNLKLSFRANGYEMGAMLPGGPVSLLIAASDPDDESFERVQVFQGATVIHEELVVGSAIEVTLDLPAEPTPQYYYAFVVQSDGDGAMSSPVWIGAAD